MLSDSFKQVILSPARTLNLIWFAFLSAPVFYAAVAWFVTAGDASKTGDFGSIRLILGVVAVVSLAVSYFVRRQALADAKLEECLGNPPARDLPGSEDLDPTEQRLATLFPHYQTTTIIVLAIRESAAVIGLILTILTGEFWLYVPFGVAAAVTLASQPPAVGSFMERALPLARRTS